MSGEGVISAERHEGADPAPDPEVATATAAFEEATRWLEEKRRDKFRAIHEFEVAARQHERALVRLRGAI